jgi:glyoxylase-like metal-dependent hydrolase (beta-lactamase superfamily II)
MAARALALVSAVLALCLVAGARAGALEVEMYRGGFASVNSFIFSNGKTQIVMDVQRKSYEADRFIEQVKAKKLPLTHILITHGHTDHFTGMARFRQAFPEARIVVATEEIKRAIKAYAVYMDSGGETGAEPALEPALKPKTPQNPGAALEDAHAGRRRHAGAHDGLLAGRSRLHDNGLQPRAQCDLPLRFWLQRRASVAGR